MANDESLVTQALKLIWTEGTKFYTTKVPSFFTPYHDAKDVALSLTAPLYAPFLLGVLVAVTTAVALCALTLCLGAYLIYGGAKLLGRKSFAEDAKDIAEICGPVSAVAAILIPCCALLSVISFPFTATHAATRIGASFATLVSNCFPSEFQQEVISNQNF